MPRSGGDPFRRDPCRVGACQPQRQRQRDEALLSAVVQIALEPSPRCIAGFDDAHARLAKAPLLLAQSLESGRAAIHDLQRVTDRLPEHRARWLREIGHRKVPQRDPRPEPGAVEDQ